MFYVSAGPQHIKKERNKARELKQSQWWKLKKAQGICYYCEKSCEQDELTMDHVVPLARGGRSTKSNCVLSCKACNNKKKHQTSAEIVLEQLKN